jgi:DNA-binding beta-propeller fold protein YncE
VEPGVHVPVPMLAKLVGLFSTSTGPVENKLPGVINLGQVLPGSATNAVKHITYVRRSPHEAFFTQDGKEVWVTVRGQNYISVLDGTTYQEKSRITVPNGPGMTIFSPDGKYGYVCSSLTAETVVIIVYANTGCSF